MIAKILLVECIGLCPAKPKEVYTACVQNCAKKCVTSSKVQQTAGSSVWTEPTAFVVLSTGLLVIWAFKKKAMAPALL